VVALNLYRLALDRAARAESLFESRGQLLEIDGRVLESFDDGHRFTVATRLHANREDGFCACEVFLDIEVKVVRKAGDVINHNRST